MIGKLLAPHSERAYALLRIVAGLMFMFHGMQKILGVLAENQPPVGSQMWIGGIIELTGGALIAIGLLTHWAAFICSGEMAVAYIQVHWKGQLDANAIPLINKGELALLYSFVFLFLACKGSGIWSVDRALGRKT